MTHQLSDRDLGIIADFNAGAGSGDLAGKWHCTRSVVCGVIFRAREKGLITRPKREPGTRLSAKRRRGDSWKPIKMPRQGRPADDDVSPEFRASMVDAIASVRADQCRFPIGDDKFEFCPNEALPKCSYCGGHEYEARKK